MRERIAWLLWCANQGYIKAEDRAILTNWFLDDVSTLHPKDLAERDGWLSMADEVIAAIHADEGAASQSDGADATAADQPDRLGPD